MCGIAGMYGRSDRERVERMLAAQAHRGPDGQQVWTSPAGMALGHSRLAIIDPEGGAQPLSNEDGSLWLAVNGEIYNHQELRQELEGRHRFKTQSDSEVLIHLYEEYGPGFVKRLDGMFAIAMWGPGTGLFLARDPLGIKPLYWGKDAEGNLLFASEIKALVDEVPVVNEFPNGCYWQVGAPMVMYDRVPAPTMSVTHVDRTLDLLDETLTEAVAKRLMADVPVGCFLSGGLDSSLIAAIMRRQVAGEMHTFAVGLEGSEDLLTARQVAAELGTSHHERVLTEREITAALPRVIDLLESCDPALVRSGIPTYFVSQMAARHVKVVLSGEGADELFGGYEYLTEFDPDWVALSGELHRITTALHNSNLQRVDRLTMAHGLEGRVPFLDRALVTLAFQLSPDLKRRQGESKWILRRLAERYLAPSVVWRKKQKFAIGTGIGPLLERHADRVISPGQMAAERAPSGEPFQVKEELLYWSHFKRRYGRDDVLSAMGRSRSLNPAERWVSAL